MLNVLYVHRCRKKIDVRLFPFFYNKTTHLNILSLICRSIYLCSCMDLAWAGFTTFSTLWYALFSTGAKMKRHRKKFGDLRAVHKSFFQASLVRH